MDNKELKEILATWDAIKEILKRGNDAVIREKATRLTREAFSCESRLPSSAPIAAAAITAAAPAVAPPPGAEGGPQHDDQDDQRRRADEGQLYDGPLQE